MDITVRLGTSTIYTYPTILNAVGRLSLTDRYFFNLHYSYMYINLNILKNLISTTD